MYRIVFLSVLASAAAFHQVSRTFTFPDVNYPTALTNLHSPGRLATLGGFQLVGVYPPVRVPAFPPYRPDNTTQITVRARRSDRGINRTLTMFSTTPNEAFAVMFHGEMIQFQARIRVRPEGPGHAMEVNTTVFEGSERMADIMLRRAVRRIEGGNDFPLPELARYRGMASTGLDRRAYFARLWGPHGFGK